MIPQTKDKHVGIEIELISPMDEDRVAEQVSLANLENYISVAARLGLGCPWPIVGCTSLDAARRTESAPG